MKQNVFNSAFELYGDEEKYKAEVSRLKKKYSRRKMMLFIGELMILSGLLPMTGHVDQEDSLDKIKKKLLGKTVPKRIISA